MRYMHGVGAHEIFVSSGVYRFYDALGQPSGVIESWTIHALPDGAHMIRVDRDGRDGGDGRSLLLETWRSPAGQIERFDLQAFGTSGDSFRLLRATCVVESDHVEVGITVDGAQREYSEIALPQNCIIFPNATVFLGELLVQAARCTRTPAFSFDLHYDSGDTFHGMVYEVAAVSLEARFVDIDGMKLSARQYRLSGPDSLAAGERILTVDEQDVVLAEEREGVNRIVLTRYARKQESKP